MANVKKSEISLIYITAFTFLISIFSSQAIIDHYFRQTLYQYIRFVFDHSFGYLPFPSIYLLAFLLLFLLFLFMKKIRETNGILGKVVALIRGTINLMMISYILFYWLWGFNYSASPLKKILQLKPIGIDTTLVFDEASLIMKQLIPLRDKISKDTNAITHNEYPIESEWMIRNALKKNLADWSIPNHSNPRLRIIKPKGILLSISTAGFYLPFVGEGQIDGGLSPIQWPFTMAHEMTHSFGITDEGECNFSAIMACIQSDNEFIQYSGLLAYWRYLANNLRDKAPYSFMELVNMRSPSIKNDIQDIYLHLDKYPDILPQFRDLVYDSYLKVNGVKEGLKSYDTVVSMMLMYKNKHQ